MSQPSLPPQISAILTMIFGAALTILTAYHIPTANLPGIESAIEMMISGAIFLAGFVFHQRIHEKHQEQQTVQRAAAVLASTPSPTSPAAWVGGSLNAAPPVAASYTRSSAAPTLAVTSDAPMTPPNTPTAVEAPVPPAPLDPAPTVSDTANTPS